MRAKHRREMLDAIAQSVADDESEEEGVWFFAYCGAPAPGGGRLMAATGKTASDDLGFVTEAMDRYRRFN